MYRENRSNGLIIAVIVLLALVLVCLCVLIGSIALADRAVDVDAPQPANITAVKIPAVTMPKNRFFILPLFLSPCAPKPSPCPHFHASYIQIITYLLHENNGGSLTIL